jgi:hypothetical protein
VNTTVNLADWPGLINMGVASPEVANSIALDASCVIVTAWLPVLVSVAIWVAFCPTGTLAKVISDGEICTASCGVSFAVFAKPAQPLNTIPPQVTIANIAAIPRPCRLPAFDSPTPFVFAAFRLAISYPPPRPFIPWGRVGLRRAQEILVRRSNNGQAYPCPSEHRLFPVPFFCDFPKSAGRDFCLPELFAWPGICTNGLRYFLLKVLLCNLIRGWQGCPSPLRLG